VLNAENVENVTITGGGAIDGDGGSGWWQYTWDDKKHPPGSLNDYRPHLTGFVNVQGLRIGGGLTLRNSPNHHIWVQDSEHVRIGGVAGELSIYAPAVQGAGLPGTDFRKGSPNTDGINVAGGTDTLIDSIHVHNNDDCVSVVASSTWKSTPGPGGVTNGYGGNVIVRNISCTYSHGLSIGSVTHGIVTNVRLRSDALPRQQTAR
jgi:polygalacturonase